MENLSFPRGFVAPRASQDLALLQAIGDQQHADLVSQAKRQVEEAGSGWSSSVGLTMEALWASFTSDTLKWVAPFARLVQGLEVDEGSTKADMVQALVRARVHPVSLSSLEEFVARWKDDQSSVGDGEGSPARSGAPDVAPP